jgi:hypothetical protein
MPAITAQQRKCECRNYICRRTADSTIAEIMLCRHALDARHPNSSPHVASRFNIGLLYIYFCTSLLLDIM